MALMMAVLVDTASRSMGDNRIPGSGPGSAAGAEGRRSGAPRRIERLAFALRENPLALWAHGIRRACTLLGRPLVDRAGRPTEGGRLGGLIAHALEDVRPLTRVLPIIVHFVVVDPSHYCSP